MLRVLEIGEKDEGPRSFSASYLWRVAYTTLVDEIRRYRRRREVDLTETPQEAPRGGGLPNPERAAAGTEIGRGIQACLATLVPPRRRAVTLYLLGHNVPEIHGLLGLRAKQAENLVYRGLGDLRKCLRSRDLAP